MPLFAKIVIEFNIPPGMNDSVIDEMISAYDDLDLVRSVEIFAADHIGSRTALDPITIRVHEE